VDARSLGQLERCMAAGDAEFGVLCADHHPGYSAYALQAASDSPFVGCHLAKQALVETALANGRSLRLTPDHRVMTPSGWAEAGSLERGDVVLCQPFVGLPRAPFDLRPELIRLLAYVSGDGHLSKDGKSVSVYTTVFEDVAAIVADFGALGYDARIYRRRRGAPRRTRSSSGLVPWS
jgi:hypothetical protein